MSEQIPRPGGPPPRWQRPDDGLLDRLDAAADRLIAEQGFPGFDADTWGGLIAPLNTPPAVVQRLNQELKLILAEPELQKKMLAAGAIATYQDGAAMKARLNADFTRWSKIAKDKNISSQ